MRHPTLGSVCCHCRHYATNFTKCIFNGVRIKIFHNFHRSPNDTELKLDLQKCEDSLPIISVVIAREQAKFEVRQHVLTFTGQLSSLHHSFCINI